MWWWNYKLLKYLIICCIIENHIMFKAIVLQYEMTEWLNWWKIENIEIACNTKEMQHKFPDIPETEATPLLGHFQLRINIRNSTWSDFSCMWSRLWNSPTKLLLLGWLFHCYEIFLLKDFSDTCHFKVLGRLGGGQASCEFCLCQECWLWSQEWNMLTEQ